MADHDGHDSGNGAYKIGSPARRLEIGRFVRGAGTYVDDLQLPNMLYAVFVRSASAHARIKSVDVEEARALPGVVAVLTGAELNSLVKPSHGSGSPLVTRLRIYPLAQDLVRYVGEPVAVAVADSRYAAQDAADAVTVDYDLLPPVLDPEQALEPAAPRLFPELETGNVVQELHIKTEEVDEVFAQADLVVSERLRSARVTACPMEARASLASYDAALGELTIWATSAGVHGVRGKVAEALGLGESKVRAIAPDIGGSFGAKNSTYPEDLAISALARQLGRPVKFTELRPEHLSSSKPGRDQIHYLDVAVRKDGRILGLRDRIVADLGAASTVDNSVSSAFLYVPGAYDVQVYQADAYGVATNKAPHGSLRGIGKADAALTLERVVDIIARKLGLDPAEVRFKNFVPEDAFPYKTATGALLDSGRYETCLKKALELAGYNELRQEQAALDRPGVRRGIGMSLVIEPTSAARRRFGGGYASCHIRMEPSGRVAVYPNIGQQGQGHQTTITQIVADRLNIPADQIDVFESDTAYTAYGPGTGSSRSSVTLMPAAMVAADLLKDKLLKIAGQVLEIDPDDLRIEGDAIRAVGLPDRSVAVREVARIAYHEVWMLPPGLEPALEMTGYFLNPNINYHPDERGRHNEFSAYPYEAVVAAVDVDLQTGAVEIVKYVSVHDCGTMLNPRIVQTQHIGCIAQGIGLALYEEMRFDEDGQLINSTFMDYLIPTVNEMPELILDHLETPTPFTPLGAKGAGETGALSPPAALGNAIQDALAPLGVELRETPYTPASLRRLIKAAAAGAPAGEQTLAAGGSARD